MRYHWLRLRAASHPTEDLTKVEAAIRFVAGTDAETTNTPIETHHGGTVYVIEATLDKSRTIRDVLGRVMVLPGARDELIGTVEQRTDDDGVFYLRLDKQEAAQGRLALTRGEDAVQARLKLEHYPATREAALGALRLLLAAGKP